MLPTLRARRKDDRILCGGADRTCRGVLISTIVAGFILLDPLGWHRQERDSDGLPVYALSGHAQKRVRRGLSPKDRRLDPRNHPGLGRPYPTSTTDTPHVPCYIVCPRCGKPNLIDPDDLGIKPNSPG